MFNLKLKWYDSGVLFMDMIAQCTGSNTVVSNVNGKEVIFGLDNGELFAFRNKCPHQKKSMKGAVIESGHIICPIHKMGFDCNTGRGGGLYLEKYQVRKSKSGTVEIGMEKFVWF